MDIDVTDIKDMQRSALIWRERGLPPRPPADAELVTEINREHSGPDVDWPEGYWLAPFEDGWVLWVFNPDDDHDAGSVFFPGAWMRGTAPPQEAALALLTAYWSRLGSAGLGSGFEQVLSEGLVSFAEAGRIAVEVWPEAEHPLGPHQAELGPSLRAQLCAARMILRVGERLPFLADDPDPSGEFLPKVGFGTAILSWALGDPLEEVCVLWLVPAADRYLLGVSSATGSGVSGIIYGCLPGDEALGLLPQTLAALFERNGHPDTPLFPARPVAVMHADNAPGGMRNPALLGEEAAALLARVFAGEPGRPIEAWFREVADPARVRRFGLIAPA